MNTHQEKDSSVKTVGFIMIIMLLSKVLGLYRDILFRMSYGTSSKEAMAFTAASTIPRNFLDFAFASVISASFIPIFNSYLEKRDKKQAFDLANNFITIVILFSTVATVLMIIFTPPIVDFSISGYSLEIKALTIPLLRIMFLSVILSGVAFSITGVLQSLGEFNIPAAMSIISNGIIIIYYFFLIDKFGVFGLAVTFIVSWITQIIIQIPSLYKKGYRYKIILNFRCSGIKEIGKLMLPVLIGSWVAPINILVNQNIASRLFHGEGATIIDTANTLYSVITGVFILSIANVIFPKLAKQNALEDKLAFSETLRMTICGMMFFLIPITCVLITLSEPIIRLFFQRGAFNELSVKRTGYALMFYSSGTIGLGLQTILSRGFYAVKDGKTPMITGVIAIFLNFILSNALVKILGVGGPAFASAISINTIGIIMLIIMGWRKKGMFTKNMLVDIMKMAFCAVIMTFVIYYINYLLIQTLSDSFFTRFIVTAIPCSMGIIVYIGLSTLLKIQEVELAYKFIFRNKKHGKK